MDHKIQRAEDLFFYIKFNLNQTQNTKRLIYIFYFHAHRKIKYQTNQKSVNTKIQQHHKIQIKSDDDELLTKCIYV